MRCVVSPLMMVRNVKSHLHLRHDVQFPARGRVVTISSGLARMAVPMRSAYVLSKYAVEGFCDVLRCSNLQVFKSTGVQIHRYEMRSWGVKVSIIEPGNYIAGTNIFTESLIQEHGRKMWEAMSEEVKADYGKDHFQARIDLMRQYSKAGNTDISPVINAFTEGLTQKYPQARYCPMDLYFKTRLFVATHLPEFVYEKLYIG
ncbi:D-beta-hydroxybutyrate dehydrogenase-like 1 [Homarus americanus]|uniref:D-beta-hydroxybutyrate dehydrogenase-like 1 n=1 Tax=Homarus americanus TaxID=6706 RepID=A0A8J5N7W2_HOMAM|nr:D-beta-hydroxybutyrate dehydrogenase-like 1 [Homarus americanus]